MAERNGRLPAGAGKVFLVGAGPGDPGLLTLRGKECLEQADVVLYDYLANPALLGHARQGAELIYVGRRGRGAYQDQEDVNRVLIERARAGKQVVRLKGGDPFVFGRGGEEAEAVAAAGLEFEVVPGVTSAVAVPAYAGIPVTHRTLASTVTFVTGHEDPEKGVSALEWPRLATADGTLVFLMGVKNLGTIVERLKQEGKAGSTPVAVIRWGTRAAQRTIVGTLDDIVTKATAARIDPPSIIVMGEVVRLRAELNWFEKRPLFGKRVLVTRTKEQAAELSQLLRALGAEPVEYPLIAVVPPEDWKALDAAVAALTSYDWVIFTSVNAIEPFMERLRASGRDVRALARATICCIGPRTAQELGRYGLRADVLPEAYQAEGLVEALAPLVKPGQRVLIPRAAVARELLPERLRALGADVQVVTAYRTIMPDADRDRLKGWLRRSEIDILTFASSSTVRNFVALFDSREDMQEALKTAVVACIGPVTAQTAKELEVPVHVVAPENTIPAMVRALVGDGMVRQG